MNTQKLKPLLTLLCKIFLIGLLIQFFIQTFVSFQLGRTGSIRSALRMRKEFILLLFVLAIGYVLATHASKYNKEIRQHGLRTCFKTYSIVQFLSLFAITTAIFLLIALLIQNV